MSLLTTKELAQKLGISIGTVYRMVHSGKIAAIRIGTGRTLRFEFEEVKKSLAAGPSFPIRFPRATGKDPLLTLHTVGIKTGIKDLAQNHDHYLYGIPIKPVASPLKR